MHYSKLDPNLVCLRCWVVKQLSNQAISIIFVFNRKYVLAIGAEKIYMQPSVTRIISRACVRFWSREENHRSNLSIKWQFAIKTSATVRLTGIGSSPSGVQILVSDQTPNRAEINPRWNLPDCISSWDRLASLWLPCRAHKRVGLILCFFTPCKCE